MVYREHTDLYRLRNADGELLYVGIAQDVEKRFEQHSGRSWWADVAAVSLENYPTRTAALAAETAAIKTEKPRYNLKQSEDPAAALKAEESDSTPERIAKRAAVMEGYVLWPKHHIYDLLACARRRPKRCDVPQSYHSDPDFLASLDDYQRWQLDRIRGLSRAEIYEMLYR